MMLQVQEQTDAVFIEARPRPHDGGRDGRFYLTSSQVIGGVEMGRQGRNLQLHLDRRYTGVRLLGPPDQWSQRHTLRKH
ncbi:hypothetical protein ACFQ0G_11790 [Streptomyces chiangmaiensis]